MKYECSLTITFQLNAFTLLFTCIVAMNVNVFCVVLFFSVMTCAFLRCQLHSEILELKY